MTLNRISAQEASYKAAAWSIVGIAFCIPYSTSLTNILCGLCLVCWLFGGRISEDLRLLCREPFAQFLLAFLAVALLSMVWSEAAGEYILHSISKLRKILLVLLFWMILNRLKEFQGKVLFSAFASLTVLLLVCIGIYFRVPGLPDMTPGQGAIFLRSHIAQGYFMALLVCLGVGLAIRSKDRRMKIFGGVVSVLAVVLTFFMTNGRTGYVCIIAAAGTLALFLPIGRGKKLMLCLVVLVAAVVMAINSTRVQNRINDAIVDIEKVEEGNWNSSIGYRLSAWKTSVEVFENNPVLGIGLGMWGTEFCNRVTSGADGAAREKCMDFIKEGNPHSDYMNWLSQFGLVGFALWLLFLFEVFRSGWKAEGGLRCVALAALASYLCGALFNSFMWDFSEGTASALLFVVILLLRNLPRCKDFQEASHGSRCL